VGGESTKINVSFTIICTVKWYYNSQGGPAFCCEEYKEFCLLVAACMRQMVERREQEQPAKIEVKSEKTTIRKTAEQRALAM